MQRRERWSAALTPILILLLVLVAAATSPPASAAAAGPAEPAAEPSGQRIAYARSVGSVEEPGAYEIFTMAADGSDHRRLTTNDAEDTHPAFSPDGTQIAFMSTRRGVAHIYVMNTDGTNVRRITNSKRGDALPEWSPNGRWIVFTRHFAGQSDLLKIRLSDGLVRRLTHTAAQEFGPEWSPDGRLIAFTRFAENPARNGIAVMRTDGSRVRLVAHNPRAESGYSDYGATWSPSGRRLAFSREDRDLDIDIYSVARDGSDVRRLTDEGSELQNPAWSSDGRIAVMAGPDIGVMLPSGGPVEIITPEQPDPALPYEWPDWSPADSSADAGEIAAARIAYVRSTNGTTDPSTLEIFTMAEDGSDHRQLTDNKVQDTHPAVSPNGRRIAFTSQRDGGIGHIWVMNADGTNLRQVTRGSADDVMPEWSPDGRRLVFVRNYLEQSDLFTIRVSGRDRARVTRTKAWEFGPEWSPNGKLIAYMKSAQDGSPQGIAVIRPDGTRSRFVTQTAGAAERHSDFGPTWSPSGRRIAFTREFDDHAVNIYSVARDGTDVRQLTEGETEMQNPSWSTDGRIAVMAGPDIGVMLPSGGPVEVITPEQTGRVRAYEWPDWAPAVAD